jgi:RsiW-degrading membrane proteinase PrsW (M82 family)
VQIALFAGLSFLPGFFWLWFYIRLNKVRPSPKRWVALTFLLGMLWSIPAGIINTATLPDNILSGTVAMSTFAISMLLIVGPLEETCKFLAVRLGSYRSSYFTEPVDGLVYSTAAALGFASLENVGYVMQFGPEVLLVRGPLTTVAHLVFASLWGYGLGIHQRSDRKRPWVVAGSLAAAALLHATYNITSFSDDYFWASTLIVLAGGIWAYRRFAWGQRISPLRFRRNYPLIECPNCTHQIRMLSTYCASCGIPISPPFGIVICGNCRQPNRPDALYCDHCGDRFLTHS